MAEKKSLYNRIKNFQLWNITETIETNKKSDIIPHVENDVHRAFRYPIPLQIERIHQDIASWRYGIKEAENAYFPHRVRMQQLFVDTVIEGHIWACMQKLIDLAVQKEYKVGSQNNEGNWIINEEATKIFHSKKWFRELLIEIVNAKFYGYSLIQLGDLEIKGKDYNFKNLMPLKRWNVSPDRYQYVQIPYQTTGLQFFDESIKDENGEAYSDWLCYIPTPSENGSSVCGYGLLYKVAMYGIILRNNLAHNTDYNQLFTAPFRWAKTNLEFDSEEYKRLESAMSNMGSMGYLITTPQEELEFLNGNAGTGHQSYADLESRCEKKISKLFLGHANGLDAQKQALSSGGANANVLNSDATPEGKALLEVEKSQNDFVLSVLNEIVYPKLRKLGFPLPENEMFYLQNDAEDYEMRLKKDAENRGVAEIAQTMKNAGLQMSAEYFSERTNIPAEKVEIPSSPFDSTFKKSFQDKFNKIHALYKHKHD